MISAMLGKAKDIAKTKNILDTWNFGVKNPVDFAKLKQLFPFPLPISKFLVQQSTLLFMRWKTQHELRCQKSCELWKMETIVIPIPNPNRNSKLKNRYCCSWDEKHIKHQCRKSRGFLETIIPISAPNIENYKFNNSTLVFLRWKTQQENFGVDSAKWKQLFPFSNSYTTKSTVHIVHCTFF